MSTNSELKRKRKLEQEWLNLKISAGMTVLLLIFVLSRSIWVAVPCCLLFVAWGFSARSMKKPSASAAMAAQEMKSPERSVPKVAASPARRTGLFLAVWDAHRLLGLTERGLTSLGMRLGYGGVDSRQERRARVIAESFPVNYPRVVFSREDTSIGLQHLRYTQEDVAGTRKTRSTFRVAVSAYFELVNSPYSLANALSQAGTLGNEVEVRSRLLAVPGLLEILGLKEDPRAAGLTPRILWIASWWHPSRRYLQFTEKSNGRTVVHKGRAALKAMRSIA